MLVLAYQGLCFPPSRVMRVVDREASIASNLDRSVATSKASNTSPQIDDLRATSRVKQQHRNPRNRSRARSAPPILTASASCLAFFVISAHAPK